VFIANKVDGIDDCCFPGAIFAEDHDNRLVLECNVKRLRRSPKAADFQVLKGHLHKELRPSWDVDPNSANSFQSALVKFPFTKPSWMRGSFLAFTSLALPIAAVIVAANSSSGDNLD
jgi:hypothetical protein